MSRAGFQKSVRMFHKFSVETMRRRGGDQAGRDGIAALAALEAVLKAERPLTGDLLEPLAAFTNLLQSSQLPPDFGDYSLGDALLALEEAEAERRQSHDQAWEFEPELDEATATRLASFVAAPRERDVGSEHGPKLSRFLLEAASAVAAPQALLVVGALAEPSLPLAELCARFERVTLNDLNLERLEALVRRAVPEPLRGRVRLERYDPTGSYAAFAAGAERIIGGADSRADAERALLDWLSTYDVGAGSAGLSAREEKPDLAISAMLLSELGGGYSRGVAAGLAARGWDTSALGSGPLASALTLLRCLVAQHHVQALLRRAGTAALVSAVSEVRLEPLPGGKLVPDGEPHDLLAVEQLVERLPASAEIEDEQSWEWRRERESDGAGAPVLTLVEAVRFRALR